METTGRTHELKEWPEPFRELADKTRHVEVRLNDRDYQVGDRLVFREYDPQKQASTNAYVTAFVESVLTAESFGGMFQGAISPHHAVLGIRFASEYPTRAGRR